MLAAAAPGKSPASNPPPALSGLRLPSHPIKPLRANYFAASVLFLCSGAATRLEAGYEIAESSPAYGPLSGTLFLEVGFTENVIGGRGNLLVPLYRDPNGKNMFFLDGNWSGNGDGNQNGSGGLGFRHRFDNPDIIVGANAFYDYGDYSGRGYNQLGAGIEVLSKWVDFRANGYFPSDSEPVVARRTSNASSSSQTISTTSSTTSSTVVIDGGEGFPFPNPDLQQTTTTTTTTTTTSRKKKQVRRTYERREAAMPGFDLELGGLIPYLDCWAETRIYAGYAWFDDPFGNDINAFTARLESRPVPAVVLNAEYKGDSRLVDGQNHWLFSARVEIPFDLGNLARGESPFAGIGEAFTPQGSCWASAQPTDGFQKDKKVIVPTVALMRNRMNEGIIRNWRPTVTRSSFEKVAERTKVSRSEQSTTAVTQMQTNVEINNPFEEQID